MNRKILAMMLSLLILCSLAACSSAAETDTMETAAEVADMAETEETEESKEAEQAETEEVETTEESEAVEETAEDSRQGIDVWTHLKRQEAAAQAYNDLLSNFALVYNEAYDESDYAYDEDYGGAYVNDEDYLVVCVKGLSEESESKYYTYCGSEDVFLTDVVFSYAELKEISRELIGLYGEKCVIRINVKENRVDLYVSPGTTLPEDLAGAPVCVTEVAVDTQEDRDKVFEEYFFQD